MRRKMVSAAVAAVAAVCVSMAATDAMPASPYTVGDLALRLAAEAGYETGTTTPAEAREILLRDGLDLPLELERPLRQDDAVAVFGQLGLVLTTSRPEAAMEAEKVDRLFDLFFAGGGLPGMEPALEGFGGEADPENLGRLIRLFCRRHPQLCQNIASRFQP